LFIVVRSFATHGPGGFPVADGRFVHHGAPSELRLYASGYDGQFVYRLALDPFTQKATAFGISFDAPAYRQQRIATAILAHAVGWLPGIGTALAIVMVNALAVVVASVAAAYLVVGFGRSSYWAPVLAIPACLPISFGRDLTEPVAWAAILVGLLLARKHAWLLAATAFTVAVLARETSLLVPGGLGLEACVLLLRRRPGALQRLWLLLPLAIEVGWQLWLQQVWGGRLPLLSGPANNSSEPLLGIVRQFFMGLDMSSATRLILGLSYLVERCVLVLLLATALWVLVNRATQTRTGEATAWALSTIVALTLSQWANDVSFLRATYESWGLSVLVLLASRSRVSDKALLGAGGVTAGVALLYAFRV
jgi:hypothetical protein